MFEGFDEFAEKHSQELQGRQILARETEPEWAMLIALTESLTLDSKGFENDKFEWVSDGDTPRLVLDSVAASFLHHERNGMPEDCRIRFDRRPPGPGKLWHDENSPLTPVVWSLAPVAVGENVSWSVPELGATPVSSSELASQIAILLAKYHLAYKKHYDNWWPSKTE